MPPLSICFLLRWLLRSQITRDDDGGTPTGAEVAKAGRRYFLLMWRTLQNKENSHMNV